MCQMLRQGHHRASAKFEALDKRQVFDNLVIALGYAPGVAGPHTCDNNFGLKVCLLKPCHRLR